jgi:hypothetical protein
MGKDRNQDDPWTPEMVDSVASTMEKIFKVEEWEFNVEKRDRALAEINKLIAKSDNFNFYD